MILTHGAVGTVLGVDDTVLGPPVLPFRSLLLDQPWSAGAHRGSACALAADHCGPCLPLPAAQTQRYRLEGGWLGTLP